MRQYAGQGSPYPALPTQWELEARSLQLTLFVYNVAYTTSHAGIAWLYVTQHNNDMRCV